MLAVVLVMDKYGLDQVYMINLIFLQPSFTSEAIHEMTHRFCIPSPLSHSARLPYTSTAMQSLLEASVIKIYLLGLESSREVFIQYLCQEGVGQESQPHLYLMKQSDCTLNKNH